MRSWLVRQQLEWFTVGIIEASQMTSATVGPPMHRTRCIDYVAVLSGELEMEIDAGRWCGCRPVTSSSRAAPAVYGAARAKVALAVSCTA